MTRARALHSIVFAVAVSLLSGPTVRADVATSWNEKAGDIVVAARLPAPNSTRLLAIVQTAAYEAVKAVTGHDGRGGTGSKPAAGASVEAAVAAANRVTLSRLVPSQQAAIESAYAAALSAIPEGPARTEGISAGEKAAEAVLASRANDGAEKPDSYRPRTAAGVYVMTVLPVATQWPERKPWWMTRPDQFRPGPPPELTSATWARDYDEIKAVGGKNSTRRTPDQTATARFWEATQPTIYHGLMRSAADRPGRDVARNARLLAVASQALDDAYIAVFDAKYRYNLWRPITAIRNGDVDGNDATERDPTWTPFIDTPLHPEYPCAHCILSATVATLLRAEFAGGPVPPVSTVSPTANGAARTWTNLDDFMHEVANARIWDGVHYRTSTDVGTDMGKKLGAFIAAAALKDR